ncbi:MAG: hypothetical protein WBK26_14930 [Burkholderiaceae bacterium]
MKKLLLLISSSVCCLAVSAQPTSFGGITPGQTTREELRALVKKPGEVGSETYAFSLELKQPEGKLASVEFHKDIVYEVKVSLVSLFSANELKPALIEKYGQPRIKVGGIRTVTCKNKLGASFERLDGEEERRWPIKDGVQGAIRHWAGNCAEYAYQDYMLRHVDTVKAIERARTEEAQKETEEKRRKLGNAY